MYLVTDVPRHEQIQFWCQVPVLQSLNRTLSAKRPSVVHSAPPSGLGPGCHREKQGSNVHSKIFPDIQAGVENKQRLCPHPRLSVTLYVSTESWQTRFHSSAPVRVLQGVLSAAPTRPRRLDFFLVSSPTEVGVKWETNRQQRKWLTAAERLGTSTPCKDTIGGWNSPRLQHIYPDLLLVHCIALIFAVQPQGKLITGYSAYLKKVVEHSLCWADENFTYDQPLV